MKITKDKKKIEDTRVPFIKEIYKFSSDKWKVRIKEEFKEIDFSDIGKDIKDGKSNGEWMYRDDGNVWCVTGGDGRQYTGYGFDMTGIWVKVEHNYTYPISKFRPASMGEVLSQLTTEFKRRGFKKGILIGLDSTRYIIKSDHDSLVFNIEDNTLTIDGAVVFNNGEWAEILSTSYIEPGTVGINRGSYSEYFSYEAPPSSMEVTHGSMELIRGSRRSDMYTSGTDTIF